MKLGYGRSVKYVDPGAQTFDGPRAQHFKWPKCGILYIEIIIRWPYNISIYKEKIMTWMNKKILQIGDASVRANQGWVNQVL